MKGSFESQFERVQSVMAEKTWRQDQETDQLIRRLIKEETTQEAECGQEVE